MATDQPSTSDKPSTKKTCLGCAVILGLLVLVIGVFAAVCAPAPEPDQTREAPSAPTPTPVRVLTVDSGRPTVRVAIPQKASHNELRRIAQRMREGWGDGQGDFLVARGDRAWRTQQLRFATAFVFFYLPGMDYERDNAWARVEIPPAGTARVTIISP